MRVLIDSGSHHLLNAGDVAMLQVCVRRLRELVPTIEIAVLTTDPVALAALCPGVAPVDATGRYELVDAAETAALPIAGRRPSSRSFAERAWRRASTTSRVPRRVHRAALRRHAHRAGPAVAAYLDALLGADLFLMSGRGGLTDAFAGETRATLGELELARAAGVPTALLGQGLGPLDDPVPRARAAAVLPSLRLVGVREGLHAPALLAAAGVSPRRIHVTGDDAVEPAHVARPDALGNAVGLNVRTAGYAGIGDAAARDLAAAIRQAADGLGAATVPVPISVHPTEDDRAVLGGSDSGAGTVGLTGGTAANPARHRDAKPAPAGGPAAAIAAAGRCRVVVTGSYHAAVFALAQGVPAVGIAASPYYAAKFEGLRDRFGPGATVVHDPTPAAVRPALERLWEAAPELRPDLLTAAARQVDAGRAVYRALLATDDTGTPPHPPRRNHRSHRQPRRNRRFQR